MLVVPRKKALILWVKDPERITQLIPHAKVLEYKGRRLVAVKHGLEECKVLRNLGLNPPSPIKYYYSWPGLYKPFEAQKATAEFLVYHKRVYCLSSIGTGKSLAALWAYDFLRANGLANKLLVVSPLSTMERTWGDEVFKHFPHLTSVVLHGTKAKRERLLDTDADVYIINHDGVAVIKDKLAKRNDIDLVIIDELSQVARNAGTARWRALNTVVNKQTLRMAWGLTGTPTPNSPTDAWAQCRLITPETVPAYFNRFRDAVMRQVGPYNWIPRECALEVVKNAMRPAIRFSREDCVDLPPVLYETRHVPLSAEQSKAYKEMVSKLQTSTVDGQVTAVNEAVKISKLLQIVCAVAYSDDGEEITIPAHARLQEVHDIIEEAGAKVIVFAPFVSVVNMIKGHLTSKHITVECVHGGVSKQERDRIFKSFQTAADPRVLVAQPAAMSHGLTLTAANTIVWFAPVFSNDTFEQANGRITRPGQRNHQFIVMLEGSPLERKIYERLKNRQKVQGALLDMVRGKEVVV